eukprot:Hpha_TRINITY_DN16517_c3_g2::TRINITY_DN16517_c3_g2_i13::g.133044::m.133044
MVCKWDWVVRQGDTPDEAKIKTMVFPFAILLFLSCVFFIVYNLQSRNQTVTIMGSAIVTFAMLQFMGGVVSNAIPANYLLDVLLVLGAVGMCAMDLGQATRSYPFRSWAFTVLILDIALVFKRYHMPLFIIPFVLVYQAALQVESVSRFGLYEAGYWGTAGVEISFCNCASPPCDSTPADAFNVMICVCFVFLG